MEVSYELQTAVRKKENKNQRKIVHVIISPLSELKVILYPLLPSDSTVTVSSDKASGSRPFNLTATKLASVP